MASTERPAANAEPDSRVQQLAQSRFFKQTGSFPPFIFAFLPAGYGLVHGVVMNLEKHTLYCSCSFRPQPCMHVLAFNQLFQQSEGAGFSTVEVLPDWVTELLSGMGGQLRLPPADPGIARERRRLDRLERAADGFDDLESWLLDTMRRGLATTVSEDPQWAENIAARMADASLTGLSRTLRLLGSIPSAQPDWADKTLGGLADIYLALRAFRQREHLPEPLLADLQNWIGLTTKKEEVMQLGKQQHDLWRIMGQVETSVEDKLKVRRTWLLGTTSQHFALLLDYTFGGAPFTPGFPTGSLQQGTVAWYPSAWPLRALLLDDFQPVQKSENVTGLADFEAFAGAYAAALGEQPWLNLFPANLRDVRVFFKHEKLYALDKMGKILPLQATESLIWRLLALAGGQPVHLFGEWDGTVLLPLTVVAERRVVEL